MLRAFAIALVAALFAGAAIYIGLKVFQKRPDPAIIANAGKICLARDLPLIKGADKDCYAPGELALLAQKPVLDATGAEATVSLSHPTNVSGGMQIAHNCAQFRKMEADGWYALSTKDMRHEAWFTRACGVLGALENAKPAKSSFFGKDGLTEADMKSLAEGAPIRLGPELETPAPPSTVSRVGESWRLTSNGQSAAIEEIATADFTGDGRADILVFVTLSAEGGTATASEVGLLEKPSPSGPVRFAGR